MSSSFKQRLTELFEHAYGDDSNLLAQSNFFNSTSKLKLNKSHQSKLTYKESQYSNYNDQPLQTTPSISNPILDKSVINPYYTKRPSFYFRSSSNSNDIQRHLRQNSANKTQQRIRKEINLLSDSFRAGINPMGKMNRPLTMNNKKDNNDFSINYCSTITSYRDSLKEKKNNNVTSKKNAKKMDLIYDLLK